MPVQINETGEIKTIGSSPNIFIELLGDDTNVPRMDWNSTKVTVQSKVPYDYVLPFEPSKVNILGLRPPTQGYSLFCCSVNQGETVTFNSETDSGLMAYGSFGPKTITLLSNILTFVTNYNGFTITALLIARA